MNETGDVRIDDMMPRLNEAWPLLPFEDSLLPCRVQYRKLKASEIKTSGKIPVIDQGESFIAGYTDDAHSVYNGPLPVIVFGDHTRRFKFIDFRFAVGAQGTHLLYPCSALDAKFFYHYLCALKLESQGYSRHYKFLKQASVPIPHLTEQRRIVAKLEALLGKVDACQKRLEKIPILLKRFRKSVLAAACSGRLTEDWPERHPQDKWPKVTVDQVAPDISYGYTAKASQDTSGVKFLRITDIQNGRVDWETVPFCQVPATRLSYYSLKRGDIVFARTGATTGKSFLIKKCPQAVFASYLIRVRAGERVIPEFLYVFFQSDDYWRQVSENIAGSAQPNCNASKLASLCLALPSMPEQHEIVRRVKGLLAMADQIEARYTNAKAHVARLTPSMLAKAFHGKLVPTEAELAREEGRDYESAEVLVERIRAKAGSGRAVTRGNRSGARRRKADRYQIKRKGRA